MALENPEILKNAGELLKDVGNSLKTTSDGGKKITIKEWVEIGTKFFTNVGVDFLDEDED